MRDRASTCESVHQTSEASDIDLTLDQDLMNEVVFEEREDGIVEITDSERVNR